MTETVKVGGLSCTLYQRSTGRWCWNYYEAGKRRTGQASDLADAKRKAKGHLEALRASVPHTRLPRAEVEEFFRWKESRKKSVTTEDASAQYLDSRTGVSDVYLRGLRADVEKFATAHPKTKIADIAPADVAAFLDGTNAGARRKNNIRGALRTWFRWCRSRQLLPDETTAVDRVDKFRTQSRQIQVFTPAELRAVLAKCGEEWQPALALQAFCGIRTEEVSRLRWSAVMRDKRLVEVSSTIAKTGRRRLVPIPDNLMEWLPSGKKPDDLVAPFEGSVPLVKRLVRAGIKWKKNGLRHAFGSYRCAILRDVAAVAFEMGNSPEVVMSHYNEAQELKTALEWFAIMPAKRRKVAHPQPKCKQCASSCDTIAA